MGVAARVAQEMGCALGREVGYSIRFEEVSTPVRPPQVSGVGCKEGGERAHSCMTFCRDMCLWESDTGIRTLDCSMSRGGNYTLDPRPCQPLSVCIYTR